MWTQIKKARRWTERVASRLGFCQNLAGLCAIGSARVFLSLKSIGISSVIVANNDHVFNLVDDCIIDITASQFAGPEIYTGPFPDSRFYYSEERRFRSVNSLCDWQYQEGWAKNQIYNFKSWKN